MPIYEFKCLKCEEFIEMLVMGQDKEIELKCPKCGGEELERVLSTTSYNMGYGSGTGAGANLRPGPAQAAAAPPMKYPGTHGK